MIASPMKIGMGDFRFGALERRYIQKVIESNRLSYGQMSKEFETKFSCLHGCKHGVFVNSGTSALQIALQSLKEHYGWEDEAEVLVPSVTFPATVNIVLHNGFKPVFVDVDPKTYNMDPEKIKEKLTLHTRAIIPVHLMGLPCDMEKIMAIANDNLLRVIEDSCEAMFVGQNGRSVGSFGDVGCFSTYVAHILQTGIGGLCTTNNEDFAIKIRSLANHGRDPAYLSIDDDDDDDNKDVIDKRYRFLSIGHSFRATELEAAIGLAQLENPALQARRKNVGAALMLRLSDLPDLQLPVIPEGLDHAFMFFPLVVDRKKEFVRHLERNGIETRDLMPLLNQPCYRGIGIKMEDYPVAKHLEEHGLAIGCHSYMSHEEIDYVVDKIHAFWA